MCYMELPINIYIYFSRHALLQFGIIVSYLLKVLNSIPLFRMLPLLPIASVQSCKSCRGKLESEFIA